MNKIEIVQHITNNIKIVKEKNNKAKKNNAVTCPYLSATYLVFRTVENVVS